MAERDDLARVIFDKIREEYGYEPYTHNLDDAIRYADAILAQWVPEHDRAVREEQRERDAQIAEKRDWPNDHALAAAIRAEGTDR